LKKNHTLLDTISEIIFYNDHLVNYDDSIEIATIDIVSRYAMVIHSKLHRNAIPHVTILKDGFELIKIALPLLDEKTHIPKFKVSDPLYTPDRKNPLKISRGIHRLVAPWFLDQYKEYKKSNIQVTSATNLSICWSVWESQAKGFIDFQNYQLKKSKKRQILMQYQLKDPAKTLIHFRKAPDPPDNVKLDFYEIREWKLKWYQKQLAQIIFKFVLKEYHLKKKNFDFDPNLFFLLSLLQSGHYSILSSERAGNITKKAIDFTDIISNVPYHKINHEKLFDAITKALPPPFPAKRKVKPRS